MKKVETKGPALGGVVLRTDTCVSPFQDTTYGRNVRVFNVGKGKIRCTVCKHEVMS